MKKIYAKCLLITELEWQILTSLASVGFVSLIATSFYSGYKIAELGLFKTNHENKEEPK